MPTTATSNPFTTSTVTSAYAPNVFTFTKTSTTYTVTEIYATAGGIYVRLTGNATSGISIGDLVRLNAGVYQLTAEADDVFFIAGPNITDVRLLVPFVGTATGTLGLAIDLVTVRILKGGQQVGKDINLIPSGGIAEIDVRKWLQSFLSDSFELTYAGSYDLDTEAAKEWQLQFGDYARALSTLSVNGQTYFLAVRNTRQAGQSQDLSDILPNTNNAFLTSFDSPTYFEGYPFSISFIQDGQAASAYVAGETVPVSSSLTPTNVIIDPDGLLELTFTGNFTADIVEGQIVTVTANEGSFDLLVQTVTFGGGNTVVALFYFDLLTNPVLVLTDKGLVHLYIANQVSDFELYLEG